MSVLRSIEEKIEGLVEGVFSRAFRSELQPVEIARKLAKEMDQHKTASVSRLYVPNEYTVWLSVPDHDRFEAYSSALTQELSSYLLEHARRNGYDLLTRPKVEIDRDGRLRTGEFGIQARLVKAPARHGAQPSQGEAGHTRIYTAVPAAAAGRPSGDNGPRRSAVLSLPDKRYVLDGQVAVIGRSRDADCMVRDPNVSRRHAELRRIDGEQWEIADLGSTNGVKINGQRVESGPLSPGDQVTLGTTSFTFDVE